MDSLSELLSAMSGISDVAAVVLAILVIVWIVNKFLEKQQEQQLLYIEQNNKTIKTISSYTEAITRLITLMESNLQETKKIGEEFEEWDRSADCLIFAIKEWIKMAVNLYELGYMSDSIITESEIAAQSYYSIYDAQQSSVFSFGGDIHKRIMESYAERREKDFISKFGKTPQQYLEDSMIQQDI